MDDLPLDPTMAGLVGWLPDPNSCLDEKCWQIVIKCTIKRYEDKKLNISILYLDRHHIFHGLAMMVSNVDLKFK